MCQALFFILQIIFLAVSKVNTNSPVAGIHSHSLQLNLLDTAVSTRPLHIL